jgi:four helix bundle protein
MRENATSFEQLIVWQKAHSFVLDVYRITKNFPDDERFGLTQQFRRAAVSIAANIAEGFRKRTVNDKVRFFNIAEGSLEECRYYLLLARDLSYLSTIENLWLLSTEVRKLLLAYRKAILAPEKP